jgi:hypothetical protein
MGMNLELRDELAARIASALADTTLSPREIAIRAYATADALLLERARPAPAEAEELFEEPLLEADPGPPHDPRWELEPRWAPADARARDRAVARHEERSPFPEPSVEPPGPGLATGRPLPADDAKTG